MPSHDQHLPPPLPPAPLFGRFHDGMGLGAALFFIYLAGAVAVQAGVIWLTNLTDPNNSLLPNPGFLLLLQLALMLAMEEWLRSKGFRLAAKSIAIGMAILFGIPLLLVAACFGFFAMGVTGRLL